MYYMYMPINYHEWDAMLEHYPLEKCNAGQHHANLKDRFVDDTE